MREIADLVGLSQAGLLHHFSSKDEVLRLRDEQQMAFNERFGREDGLDAVRYLLDLNARQVELVGDRRCAGALPECVGFLGDWQALFSAVIAKLGRETTGLATMSRIDRGGFARVVGNEAGLRSRWADKLGEWQHGLIGFAGKETPRPVRREA